MLPSPRHLRGSVAAAAVLGLLAVSGCDGSGFTPDSSAAEQPEATAAVTPVSITANIEAGARQVAVNTLVKVEATDGTLSNVAVVSSAGEIAGRLLDDGHRWVATERLEPGVRYRIKATGSGADGAPVESVTAFRTRELSLDEQTYPSIAPLDGETVGVGMPVVVSFDLPVTDKAAFEKNMTVTSVPAQTGSWHWISDTEAHWRPRKYWKAGSEVSVDVDINGVDAGNGIYGQEDRDIDFSVGDAHIYKVDARTHQMKVFENGTLLRTLPITTGKEGFTTRSGVKVIMEKFASRRMNSETVGIPQGSAEAYDIDDVQWAMRLTSSGEFIHAAPWSVGSQGRANVSHGCTGMSTANASWLYDMTIRGDVVETVGTGRPMEATNGYGDWNVSWADYTGGSALS